jgi:acyl carrier protein
MNGAAGGNIGRAMEAGAPVVEVVREVWTDVLRLAATGESNFFELGGHSLLAAEVTARLEERLGVRVPLRLYLEKPVLGEFAAVVEELVAGQSQPRSSVAG